MFTLIISTLKFTQGIKIKPNFNETQSVNFHQDIKILPKIHANRHCAHKNKHLQIVFKPLCTGYYLQLDPRMS